MHALVYSTLIAMATNKYVWLASTIGNLEIEIETTGGS
jgi:hypothetical protein